MPAKRKLTRAAKLKRLGIYDQVMWHEQYAEERVGDFARERDALETETLEQIWDRWCRGQNLLGFAPVIIRRLDQLRKIVGYEGK